MQSLSYSELTHYTNLWCKTMGIKSIDLGCHYRMGPDGVMRKEVAQHPQIDDVILLVSFLNEYLNELTPCKRVYLHILWNWVYIQKKPLTKQYLKQLGKLTNKLNSIRYHKQQLTQQARMKIKQLQNPTIS